MPPLAPLERWFAQLGINYDGLSIVCGNGSYGTSVIATRDFAANEVLASIPKHAILSIRTTSCAAALDGLLRGNDVSESSALNVAVAYERALGSRSRWHRYLDAIAAAEPLPFLWPKPERARLLAGTGIEELVRRKRRELEREFHHAVRCLADQGERTLCAGLQLQGYLAAASLTSSRAFYVDSWHGEALVPFADLLNHKAALLPVDAQVEGGGGSGGGGDDAEG